ncbi:elongation factor P [Ornithobacterium rhinotracheale]|uniref:Elongation factor P n=1 Tax=Ornithobacterium rhinotracheale (strain ATCC 51463 / DSM 15997 / CCUG 23171 / CIP 104009 / LMG 9086) TaxID=867902 RepID=I3ZZI1_ORNRL|nr:elongation factor P [Ornithobacterium rhinotracheale]AFL97115.1 translation elongation factor P [Ornithobacterium rhinotracheale DSM 15997]AIP99219.1 elongation factor P [Ornithobacterium rhinotracheale ORT-UMN 88]KGB67082.1 elongation factor P [Ornithobacterium rhinotracheale H06-030791]MBN3662315.1 elongation factor P [Ornithobacterium rhinotracheale]MCK0194365.1 elongation factor P [Ornithobacterium rhinotracheale]
MATTSDIRKGMCIEWNNDTYKIIEFLHVKPGKGPAFVRTKLKSVTNGKVLDNTFSAGHKIDDVRVETRKYQYLYDDENGFHFMNNDDYTQVYLNKDMIENPEFMKNGEEVTIIFRADDETPLSAELPATVIMEITHTEPGVKGDTATNATKPATTETGAEIRVPLFIQEGDKVKISTEDGSYQERIKE